MKNYKYKGPVFHRTFVGNLTFEQHRKRAKSYAQRWNKFLLNNKKILERFGKFSRDCLLEEE